MTGEMLDLLVAHHPGFDVAINAHRLVPGSGYLVEYDAWHDGPPQPHVAFIRMVGGSALSLQLQFAHNIGRA